MGFVDFLEVEVIETAYFNIVARHQPCNLLQGAIVCQHFDILWLWVFFLHFYDQEDMFGLFTIAGDDFGCFLLL